MIKDNNNTWYNVTADLPKQREEVIVGYLGKRYHCVFVERYSDVHLDHDNVFLGMSGGVWPVSSYPGMIWTHMPELPS